MIDEAGEFEQKIYDQQAELGRIMGDPAGDKHQINLDMRMYQGMHELIATQESYIALLKQLLIDCNDSILRRHEFNAPED